MTTATISGFDPNDARWADLYRACVADDTAAKCGADCMGLCRAVLTANPPPAFASYSLINGCEVTCGAPITLTAAFVTAVCGRRPSGEGKGAGTLGLRRRGCADRRLVDYLCEAAELEAASVPAFGRLASDLAHHGAPAPLVRGARVAMADEARHWRRTRDLARRHGGNPTRPDVPSGPPLSLEETAVQNVVEGCVRETFGAMVAAHQASVAGDSDLRLVMRDIARDELAHAALSWTIDAWALSRLGETFRQRRRGAAIAAVQELVGAVTATSDAPFLAAAGLPDRDRSLALLATASAQIWEPSFG